MGADLACTNLCVQYIPREVLYACYLGLESELVDLAFEKIRVAIRVRVGTDWRWGIDFGSFRSLQSHAAEDRRLIVVLYRPGRDLERRQITHGMSATRQHVRHRLLYRRRYTAAFDYSDRRSRRL